MPPPTLSLSRPLTSRAIHLRVTPRPSNLSESREILRLLNKFGEVEYFKNLKYDTLTHPNTSLVIFREEKAAEQALKRSPIRIRIGEEYVIEEESVREVKQLRMETDMETERQTERETGMKRPRAAAPFGLPQTQSRTQARPLSTKTQPQPQPTIPTPTRPTPNLPFLPPTSTSSSQPPKSRIFQLQTNPARASFRDAIDRSQYHGRFAIDGKSVIQQDLAKRVPVLGMSCWDWRLEIPERVAQRVKGKMGEGERSLRSVWEEGMGRTG
ncbi:hypothetical protein Q7P37_004621 [Cladosporium fusiforme]